MEHFVIGDRTLGLKRAQQSHMPDQCSYMQPVWSAWYVNNGSRHSLAVFNRANGMGISLVTVTKCAAAAPGHAAAPSIRAEAQLLLKLRFA